MMREIVLSVLAIFFLGISLVSIVSQINGMVIKITWAEVYSEALLLSQRVINSADCLAYEKKLIHYDPQTEESTYLSRVFTGVIDMGKVYRAIKDKENGLWAGLACIGLRDAPADRIPPSRMIAPTTISSISDVDYILGLNLYYRIEVWDVAGKNAGLVFPLHQFGYSNICPQIEEGSEARYVSRIPVTLRYPEGDNACAGEGPCTSIGVLHFDFCIYDTMGIEQRYRGEA